MESTEFKKFFKYRKEEKCPYPYHIDTYGKGCVSNCKFCFAKSILVITDSWNGIKPSVANIKSIERKIKRNLKEGDLVRMGSLSDCMQPFEDEFHVTLETIKLLNKYRIGYLIVTKYARVANDEFMEIYDKDLAHFQITLTSTDDDFCKTYEGADPPSERIKAIEKLYNAGFDVSIRLSPLVVEFVDNGKLDFNKLCKIKCDKILVEFLRVNHWIKRWFKDYIDVNRYSLSALKFFHINLDEKEKYIKMLTNNKYYKNKQLTFAEYIPEHDKFWRENYDANPLDCCNLTIKKEG